MGTNHQARPFLLRPRHNFVIEIPFSPRKMIMIISQPMIISVWLSRQSISFSLYLFVSIFNSFTLHPSGSNSSWILDIYSSASLLAVPIKRKASRHPGQCRHTHRLFPYVNYRLDVVLRAQQFSPVKIFDQMNIVIYIGMYKTPSSKARSFVYIMKRSFIFS
jgi:hypothetical protein